MHHFAARSGFLGTVLARLALIACGLASAPAAHAIEYKIYSPYVELGESELEARGHYNLDDNNELDGSNAYRVAFGHAFTDFWASELYGVFEGEGGEATKFEEVEWENRFQLTPQGKYWADLGLLVETDFPVDEENPYELRLGPLLEKSFGRVITTINLLFEHQFATNAGAETEFTYSGRLRYRLNPYFEPAIEAYGGPGGIGQFAPSDEQIHQIGPGFYGEAQLGGRQKFNYSAVAVYGLTQTGSPDWTLVARFEYEF